MYSVPSTIMHVHRSVNTIIQIPLLFVNSVKPAVFDLVLALSIAGYSALVYLLVGVSALSLCLLVIIFL